MSDNRLKLTGGNELSVLDFDGSTYAMAIGDLADASKNKIITFNLWLDTSTHGSSERLIWIINDSAPSDHLTVILSDGRINLTTSNGTVPGETTYLKYNIDASLLNRVLNCKICKAERDLRYFMVDDVSLVNVVGGDMTASGSTTHFGNMVDYATIWDIRIFDYDTSAFSGDGTLINYWKGYPVGNTNTAWVDLAGSVDLSVSSSRIGGAVTRNISGYSGFAGGNNKLKLLGVENNSNEINKLMLNEESVVSYEAEATALFARMTEDPCTAIKTAVNAVIRDLKGYGIWNKLDFLAVYAMHTQQAALLDWKDYINHINQNAMDFTAYSGFSYDTSIASVYINSNFNPSTNGVNYTLNDAMMGVWVEDRGDTAGTALMGTRLSGQYASYLVRNPGYSTLYGTINTSDTVITSYRPWNWGLVIGQRESSTVVRGVVNASLGVAVTQASGRPTGRTLWIRGAQGYTTPGFSRSLFRASVAGASLTETEHQNFYNVMNTFMTAMDAL